MQIFLNVSYLMQWAGLRITLKGLVGRGKHGCSSYHSLVEPHVFVIALRLFVGGGTNEFSQGLANPDIERSEEKRGEEVSQVSYNAEYKPQL